MFFWNKFCGLIMLFFILNNFSYAQCRFKPFSSSQKFQLKIYSPVFYTHVEEVSKISFPQFDTRKKTLPVFPFIQNSVYENARVPASFVTCDYGFFCRQELKIEKATRLPIRVRLGSLEQCNYYEGKP